MNELRRYSVDMVKHPFNKSRDYYRCSDVDPKLDEIVKLKALNGELTSALRLICAADNMTEAKIAVVHANTLLQSKAAK